MLHDFVLRFFEVIADQVERESFVVGVDETEGVEGAALAVGGAAPQIRLQELLALAEVAAVDYAERGRGRELGPVDGLAEPFEVLAEEAVIGGAGVHEGVGEGDGGVEDRIPGLEAVLDLVQDGLVGPVVAEKELEV